jgi:hypothetical protein
MKETMLGSEGSPRKPWKALGSRSGGFKHLFDRSGLYIKIHLTFSHISSPPSPGGTPKALCLLPPAQGFVRAQWKSVTDAGMVSHFGSDTSNTNGVVISSSGDDLLEVLLPHVHSVAELERFDRSLFLEVVNLVNRLGVLGVPASQGLNQTVVMDDLKPDQTVVVVRL